MRWRCSCGHRHGEIRRGGPSRAAPGRQPWRRRATRRRTDLFSARPVRVARLAARAPPRSLPGTFQEPSRSEWLGWLLAHEYSPPPDSSRPPARAADGLSACEAGLLGELQLSFLLFLRLSCLASLEQWKRLVSLLCGCEAALKARDTNPNPNPNPRGCAQGPRHVLFGAAFSAPLRKSPSQRLCCLGAHRALCWIRAGPPRAGAMPLGRGCPSTLGRPPYPDPA